MHKTPKPVRPSIRHRHPAAAHRRTPRIAALAGILPPSPSPRKHLPRPATCCSTDLCRRGCKRLQSTQFPHIVGLVSALRRGVEDGHVVGRYFVHGIVVARAFATDVLLPELKPGDTVVLDNLGAHRCVETRALFADRGIHLKFLPPYSPELNPIELWWHWLKTRLRSRGARTHEALDESIAFAKRDLPRDIVANWVRGCGYA